MKIPVLENVLAECDDALDAAQLYHEGTKETRLRAPALARRARACHETVIESHMARSWKRYDGSERIALPRDGVSPVGVTTLAGALDGVALAPPRRSIGLGELALLLKSAYGPTGRRSLIGNPRQSIALRAAHAAGDVYSLEIYALVFDVPGCGPGLYHYDVVDHALEILRPAPAREATERLVCDGGAFADAVALLVVTAVFTRSLSYHLFRGYRYLCQEVGALAQNIGLLCRARGIDGQVIGSFYDDEVGTLLGLDNVEENAMLIFALGSSPASTLSGFDPVR